MTDYARINAGLALYHEGEAWSAHEAWEEVWHQAEGADRATLQALIQVAAAVHKHQQGVPAGVTKNLDKALANIRLANAAARLGFDLVGLAQDIRRARAADAADFSAPALPRATGPDGFVYLHGFASSPSSNKARRIAPALEARGWSVAVPDLNEDDFTHLTVTRALARTRRLLRDRTILIGSSLGGYISALLHGDEPRVVALVLMAPAFEFIARQRDLRGEAFEEWRRDGVIEVEHYGYGRMMPIAFDLFTDAEKYSPRPALGVPTYILQGTRDDVVPASMVSEVASSAPEGLVEYDEVDDDHALGASVERALHAAVRHAEALGFVPDPAPR